MNLAPQNPSDTYRYKAFISYRHADNQEQDREWASWLHTRLETWQIPPELIGKINGRGERIPESLYPVFRDEQSLPADADLASGLQYAIEQSGVLVVLCSPRSVQSKYVEQEIQHFQRLGRQDRIIGAILDGEPNASRDPAKAGTECFPEPLRRIVTGEGVVELEPLAADFRFEGNEGFTRPERVREMLMENGLSSAEAQRRARTYADRLDLAFLKIAAGILGVPLEDLVKRDQAFQLKLARRRTRILMTVAASLLALTVVALWQWNEANRNRQKALFSQREAEKRASRTEFERAPSNEIRSSHVALPFLSSALQLDTENEAAALALDGSLRRVPHMMPLLPIRDAKEKVACLSVSRSRSQVAAIGESGLVRIWDCGSAQPLIEFDSIQKKSLRGAFSDASSQIFIWSQNDSEKESEAGIWDTTNGSRMATWKSPTLEILEGKWIDAERVSLLVRNRDADDQSMEAYLVVLNAQGKQLWKSSSGILFSEVMKDGKTLTTICSDDAARWFDVASGKVVREVYFSEKLQLREYGFRVDAGRQIGGLAVDGKHEKLALSMGHDLGTTSDGLSQGASGEICIIDLVTGDLLHRIVAWPYPDEVDGDAAQNARLTATLGAPLLAKKNEEEDEDEQFDSHGSDLANAISFDQDGKSLVASLLITGTLFIQLEPALRITALPTEPQLESQVDTEHYFRGANFFGKGDMFYSFCRHVSSSGRSAKQVPYVQFWSPSSSEREGQIEEVCMPLQDQDRLRDIANGFTDDSIFFVHQSGAIVEYALHEYNAPLHQVNLTPESSIPLEVAYKAEYTKKKETVRTLLFDFQENMLPVVELEGEQVNHFVAELDTIRNPEAAAINAQQNLIAIFGSAGKYGAGGLEIFRMPDGKREIESLRTYNDSINRVAFSPNAQLIALYSSIEGDSTLADVIDLATGERIPFHQSDSLESSLVSAFANAPSAIAFAEIYTGQRRTARGLERIPWNERASMLSTLQAVLKRR